MKWDFKEADWNIFPVTIYILVLACTKVNQQTAWIKAEEIRISLFKWEQQFCVVMINVVKSDHSASVAVIFLLVNENVWKYEITI